MQEKPYIIDETLLPKSSKSPLNIGNIIVTTVLALVLNSKFPRILYNPVSVARTHCECVESFGQTDSPKIFIRIIHKFRSVDSKKEFP